MNVYVPVASIDPVATFTGDRPLGGVQYKAMIMFDSTCSFVSLIPSWLESSQIKPVATEVDSGVGTLLPVGAKEVVGELVVEGDVVIVGSSVNIFTEIEGLNDMDGADDNVGLDVMLGLKEGWLVGCEEGADDNDGPEVMLGL